jgi:hypothetical protein
MGFGHRVYKNYDPRAKIIKAQCDALLNALKINDPLLDIAVKLEEAALNDSYFVERKLYPNVDFYSGIIMRAIGIPVEMFTVIFAIGRMPGWIANYLEISEDKSSRIYRPRQVYVGPWSPLAGGRLVDPNPIDLHSPGHALRIRVREVMDQVARELGVTRTGVALAWLMKHPVGIVPIIGSTHPDRVRESVAALGIELTREQWYRILEAAVGQRLP